MYDFLALPISHATNLTTIPATILIFDNVEVIDPNLRTSYIVKNRSRYYDQYYYGAASTSCSNISTPYLMYLFISYDNCSFDHTAFCRNIFG